MTAVHGKNTQVMLDALDISGYLNTADFNVEVDTADTSVFMATWKTALTGQIGGKLEAQGYYDPLLTKFTPAMLSTAGSVLTYGPGGLDTIGDPARLIPVLSTSYGETSPVGGVVGFKWAVMADAGIGFGAVLHPLGTDATTTNGAERDDAAATASGWQAHLHVTACSGSWVVKLQDAAVSNTYSDVTLGAFTAATGATQQRLTSAAATTALRRYVRYVATGTGSITFSLSYARNV
jgi:hypothetical protein